MNCKFITMRSFQDFVLKGKILDLTISIVAGISVNKIIESLIIDIILPTIFTPIFRSIGAKDLESLMIGTTRFGAFCANIISFAMTALILFLIIKAIASFRRKEQRLDAADSQECPYCLSIVPISAVKCGHCTSDLPPAI